MKAGAESCLFENLFFSYFSGSFGAKLRNESKNDRDCLAQKTGSHT